jgi:predicted nuclease with TOPRIM domain
MEKEFIFVKENQRCAISALRADLERQHKLEQKRLEAINILELQNFERFLDEKDARINELELENNNVKSKLNLQREQYVDLQSKFNGLIDQSDQLTVQYR